MEAPRVVFMGTPDFALPIADVVLHLGYPIVAVYTAPDRPVGRGMKVRPTPVKEWATSHGLPVYTPAKLSLDEERERFLDLDADLVVLAAYGLLLPKTFLFAPAHGAVNVHPSLLPRHRGAAPVAAAILAGDRVTGTSIMVMDQGLDTGPVLARREVPLQGDERTPALTDRLFRVGADLLTECLPGYVLGQIAPEPQPDEGVSVTKRFTRADGEFDWSAPAAELERRVRAFDPWPGTFTTWNGRRLEVVEAAVAPSERGLEAGTVVRSDDGAGVVTGEGLLLLLQVKLEGRVETPIQDFLRGHGAFVGARLPS